MNFKQLAPSKINKSSKSHPTQEYLSGLEYHKIGKYVEAIQFYDKAIELTSQIAEIHYNRGVALRKTNNQLEALKSYENAVKIRTNYPEAYFNIANILRDNGAYEKALESYTKAIHFNPNYTEAYLNRGIILKMLGKFIEALKNYDTAISLKPHYAAAFFNRGNALIELKSFDDALQSFDRAIELDPHHPEYFYNRGNARRETLLFEAALKDYTEALTRRPNYASAYSNRGVTLYYLKRTDEALFDFSRSQLINPEDAEPHLNESFCRLSIGDFEEGWSQYEWRLKEKNFQKSSLLGHADITTEFSVRNSRSDFNGKTVFVASEQGVGDHIMFMSMLPELLQDSGSVICQLDPRLLKLFSRCFPLVRFVPRGDVSILETVEVDSHIRMGSLGYTYRQDISLFPGTPYLIPDPERVVQWKERISLEPGKLRVGISWRGGSSTTNGADRSMALEQLTSLLDREDCNFISLQYGEVEAEVAAFNEGRSRKLVCFEKKEIDDFEDFAGLIGALDCVISVQNTTVHTCGALGKPCFAMLPFRPEWRYGASGDTMPWYKSVKLFRQIHDGQWSDVIEHIIERLNIFKIQNISK